ncbi:hypothetical protein RHGRI_013558 [Rhododendron griersonianum]|uniref:Uncharacterized protein n=1 Tax=Rhododendron griersonianum TaxID=479676 RepID=A0AAV6K6A8_9ERIC|nr:hypothetical protein RHGRI_013558 [Rhododendron griersonianum]
MAEEAVLGFLEKNEEITDSGQFAAERGIDHQDIANIIKSLHGFKLVDAQDIKRESWVLTEEGKTYAAAGSPEVQVFLAVPPEGISLDELQRKMDPTVFKIGRSQAIKNQWVEMGKQLTRKVQDVDDKVKDLLIRIQDGEVIMSVIDLLSLFQFRVLRPWKGYSVRKGPKYAPRRKKFATDLTRENILRGDWKDLEFKEYNFSAKGQPVGGGSLHPLLKITRFAFHMKTAKIIAKAIVVIYILVIAGHCATANQDDFPADGVPFHLHIFALVSPQEEGECKVLDFWSWALVFAYRFEEMPTNNFVESR